MPDGWEQEGRTRETAGKAEEQVKGRKEISRIKNPRCEKRIFLLVCVLHTCVCAHSHMHTHAHVHTCISLSAKMHITRRACDSKVREQLPGAGSLLLVWVLRVELGLPGLHRNSTISTNHLRLEEEGNPLVLKYHTSAKETRF